MFKQITVITLVLLFVSVIVFAHGQKDKLGGEENPIVWSFVPSGEMQMVASGAREVADMLHDKTGLYFSTNVATEYAGVIEALRSDPPTAHISSLATFAYVMAADMGVSKAALVSSRYGSAFYAGQIIARVDSGITQLSDLKGKTFARVDPLSTSGWIIPNVMLKAAGIDTDKDIKVVDAGSHDAVVAAVFNGEVDAGACYLDGATRIPMRVIGKEHPDAAEKLATIKVSPNIPNDGVQFHPSVPKEMRDMIVDALMEMVATEEGKKALNTAYQWTDLERHGDEFYDPFRQVLQAAGVNVKELIGQ